MNDNVLFFNRPNEPRLSGVDVDLAKRYFIEEVLPYTGKASLLRMLQANAAGDLDAVKLEMTRMFLESEVLRPSASQEANTLQVYFAELK